MSAVKTTNTGQQYRRSPLVCLLATVLLSLTHQSYCQEGTKTVPNGTDGLILTIPPEDTLVKQLPGNEFDGAYSTFKIGMGYIGDVVTYKESDVFKQQMDSAGLSFDPTYETRDFRLMFSGVFKKTRRPISWKFAYMYDGDQKKWMIRESGVTIAVPELFGHIFIGRTKEGWSMIKVMNGHSGWTAERQMALDVVPILADGIKWFGFMPKPRIFWNLGYYNDVLSEGQGFSTYASQFSGRIGWLPYYNKEQHKVIHIATNLRYGKPVDGKIAMKSRPESSPAPQILNTGTFQSDHSTHTGLEAFYSNGALMIGTEVVMHDFRSETSEDHKFYGGEVSVGYLFNGIRPYNTTGSFFGFVRGKKSVFKGGWGAWEAVLRLSTLDLNDQSIHGGKFWRITPMVNWYMSRIMRMEFIYGYGVLDRYNLSGNLQIYQARLQLSIL